MIWLDSVIDEKVFSESLLSSNSELFILFSSEFSVIDDDTSEFSLFKFASN